MTIGPQPKSCNEFRAWLHEESKDETTLVGEMLRALIEAYMDHSDEDMNRAIQDFGAACYGYGLTDMGYRVPEVECNLN